MNLINLIGKTKVFYSLLFSFCVAVFIFHYIIVGQAVYGDGIDYYAYLHSVYFDHDLNFTNEYKHVYSPESNNYQNLASSEIQKTSLTPTGKTDNLHPPGTALLLSPFYVTADLLALILNALNFRFFANGYSDIYQILVGIGSIFYAVIGLFIAEKLILGIYKTHNLFKKEHSKFIRLSILTVLLSSPLFYYAAIDVINSHAVSFFTVSLFFYVLFKNSKTDRNKYILLGLILGLATMVRAQEFLLIVPLVLYLIAEHNRAFKKIFVPLVLVAVLFLISILPMLFIWNYLYGNIFYHPYFSVDRNISLLGSIARVNGLLIQTPFLIFSLIALPAAIKKVKKETLILLSYFLIQYVLLVQWGGVAAAYGARMIVTSLFIFMLLTSQLYLGFSRSKKYLIYIIFIFFVALNFVNILNFMIFQKESSGGRGLEGTTRARIEKLINLLR